MTPLRTRAILLAAAGAAIWVVLVVGPGWVAQARAWMDRVEAAGVHHLTKSITGEK